MTTQYPCMYPGVCSVTYHLDPSHCEGDRRKKAQAQWDNRIAKQLDNTQNFEASLGQRANLSGFGLEGNWYDAGENESGNNVYVQAIKTGTENQNGTHSDYMANLVQIEDDEDNESFNIRIINRGTGSDIRPPQVATDEDLSRRVVSAHKFAESFNMRVTAQNVDNPVYRSRSQKLGLDSEWEPAPTHQAFGLDFRKPLRESAVNSVGNIPEPDNENELSAIPFIAITENEQARVVTTKRAIWEQNNEVGSKDLTEDSTNVNDFRRHNSPFRPLLDRKGVQCGNGVEITAPAEMRDDLEQAAREYNEWVSKR